MSVPSVAELIRDHGRRLNTRRCSNCRRWSLYWIELKKDGFDVCLTCDTNAESRKTAKLQESS